MLDREELKQSVVDQLAWDTRVDASDVSVKVDDGKVILSGTVPVSMTNSSSAIPK